MYTANKRRVREAEKRVERLHYKFINDYVKCLHKDTFDKAEELYRKIRQLYPHNVKDLTKTVEFMKVTTPDKAIPRYYACRKTTGTTEMEMVLRIPLITAPPAAEVLQPPTAEVSQPPAAEVLQPPTAEVSQPPAAEVLQPPTAEVLQPPTAEVLQPLPEEAYEELLKELQKNPHLMRILDDLTHDLPHDDVFTHDNDIFDAIMPDDISPLEKELLLNNS